MNIVCVLKSLADGTWQHCLETLRLSVRVATHRDIHLRFLVKDEVRNSSDHPVHHIESLRLRVELDGLEDGIENVHHDGLSFLYALFLFHHLVVTFDICRITLLEILLRHKPVDCVRVHYALPCELFVLGHYVSTFKK